MNWKQSLDRYLTTPPDDGFDNWVESVADNFSDEFYNCNADWVDSCDGLCNQWLNDLFKKGIDPNRAARIIERAFYLHKQNR